MWLHFLITFGKKTIRTQLRFMMKRRQDGSRFRMSQDFHDKAVKVCGPAFYMWVLQGLRHRGNHANLQIYFLTSIVMFRGISRRGVDMFSKFSMTLPVRTFDKLKKDQLRVEQSIVR
jgi:hypothetical protein